VEGVVLDWPRTLWLPRRLPNLLRVSILLLASVMARPRIAATQQKRSKIEDIGICNLWELALMLISRSEKRPKLATTD
jgi:hypothetical protein